MLIVAALVIAFILTLNVSRAARDSVTKAIDIVLRIHPSSPSVRAPAEAPVGENVEMNISAGGDRITLQIDPNPNGEPRAEVLESTSDRDISVDGSPEQAAGVDALIDLPNSGIEIQEVESENSELQNDQIRARVVPE